MNTPAARARSRSRRDAATWSPATSSLTLAGWAFALGIDAVVEMIDGGANTARHNGDPRQCTNVSCR